MTSTETLAQLDELIRSRSITEHPFYVAWNAGELNEEQLATYATMYFPHVSAFPDHLACAVEGAQDEDTRAELQDNLKDELTNPKSHPELWLDFAEGLGLMRIEVECTDTHRGAEGLINVLRDLCKEGTAQGLAGLYAYEAQQPEVSKLKMQGLQELYNVTEPATLEYFAVHAEADVRHRAGERLCLERSLEQGADPAVILDSASKTLDAYWGLLDAVCDETGVSRN